MSTINDLSTTIDVRRLGPADWALFRQVRLAALADSPDAFSSTLAQEQDYPEQRWRKWMRPERGLKTVAMAGDDPVGVAGGFVPDGESVAHLYSMWVSPRARGRGVGAALAAEVLDWAREQGHDRVELWVVDGNRPAQRLYDRLGFQATRQTQPHPHQPDLTEMLLRRRVAP